MATVQPNFDRAQGPNSDHSLRVMNKTPTTPIAVIGMACRLPGGIDSPDQLWEALLRGEDLVTEVPPERWDIDEYYDPEPGVPGRSDSQVGRFPGRTSATSIPSSSASREREATAMDPQHRLLLETSWEAMEHAGLTPAQMADSLTGVFIGFTHGDYQFVQADDRRSRGARTATPAPTSAWRPGGSPTPWACAVRRSPSTPRAHPVCLPRTWPAAACNDGESDLAFAGGAYAMLEPRRFASGSANGMLSRTGRCHAFDVEADGFVSGEGVVVLLLKRLPDAQRDGDRILAVIRGTAANQDGHTVNIVTPSADAQDAVYRAALAAGDVDPATVGMIEAHGTGTPVGDPIEYASLAAVYGIDGPLCARIGEDQLRPHPVDGRRTGADEGGPGRASTALVPQNLHFNTHARRDGRDRNQSFCAARGYAVADQTTRRRPDGRRCRRTACRAPTCTPSSNKLPQQQPVTAVATGRQQRPGRHPGLPAVGELGGGAARNRGAAGRLGRRASTDLDDLGSRLHAGPPPRAPAGADGRAGRHRHRAVRRRCGRSPTARSPIPAAVGPDDRGPVWVFSGQGSQWAEMGKDLLATEPVFAAKIAEIEPLIAEESGFSVTEAMTAPEKVTGIDRVQPTLFAMQVALAATMKSYGVQPGRGDRPLPG